MSTSEDSCVGATPVTNRDAGSKWIVLAAFAFATGYLGTQVIDREHRAITERPTPLAMVDGMVLVPGGQFRIGSVHRLAQPNERPVHAWLRSIQNGLTATTFLQSLEDFPPRKKSFDLNVDEMLRGLGSPAAR